MVNLASVLVLASSYLIGSIPFGLLLVRLKSGKDVRHIESGRTGGTNAFRAAGFSIGLLTAIMDMLKGMTVVYITRWILGESAWIEILAPVIAIIGHNYSIYLLERDESGKIRLRGGAGGATCLGGSAGLWFPSLLIILPLGGLILYLIGYASVATISVAIISTIIFSIRGWLGFSPWEYALYGVMAFVVLCWTLRPNIQRLMDGTERMVGLRVRNKSKGNLS